MDFTCFDFDIMTLLIYLNILIAVIILGFPFYFLKKPPRKINSIYGYRTPRSMKDQETWDLANRTWAKNLFKYSVPVVIVQMALWVLYDVGISLFGGCATWLLAIGLAFYETEKRLDELT